MTNCPDDGSATEQPFEGPPLVDGRYLLKRRLGRGGMGDVYEGVHVAMERPVAIKRLREEVTDPEARARFQAEAVVLARLKHEAIVDVLDYGVDPRGFPYLVMELLTGGSLADRLAAGEAFPPRDALVVLSRVARALDLAHGSGVLHRDVKPANIVFGSGAAASAKLVDFGLARLREAVASGGRPRGEAPRAHGLTEVGHVVGTRGYLAPEVLEGGPATPASDIFSFAVVASELLSGMGGAASSQLASALSPEARERPQRAQAVVDQLLVELARAERSGDEVSFRAAAKERRRVIATWALPLVLVAAWLSGARVLDPLESRLLDARYRFAPRRPPDPRIVVVTLDDATLRESDVGLAARSDELGDRLRAAFEAGAAGVAVDLVLPASWSRSTGFARLVLERAPRLTLAATLSRDGEVLGTECIQGATAVALGEGAARSLFGLIDFRLAGGTAYHVDPAGPLDGLESFALRAARTLQPVEPLSEPRLVDYTVDIARIERFSWRELPAVLEKSPERVRGRLLVVGADFAVSGDLRRLAGRPADEALAPGVLVQAAAADGLLSARPLVESRPLSRLAGAVVALLGLLAASRTLRPLTALAWCVLIAVGFLGIATLLFVKARLVLNLVGPAFALALGSASGRVWVRMWNR